jgi:2-dehydropantoate 2-reductase
MNRVVLNAGGQKPGEEVMRIAVFGAGGVGGYFGGRLALAGEDVVFIARGAHLQAMRTQGLRVESLKGNFMVPAVQATDNPAEVGPVDVVLVAVKTWQVPEAAQAIHSMVGPETCVVPLQNGLEAPAQLAAVLGTQHVLGGTCVISCSIAAPGYIQHVGLEPSVSFGALDHRASPRAERLRHAFMGAEVGAVIPADIQVAIWEKFMAIRFGPVGAVARAPAGVLRSVPETRLMIEQACHETLAVARARGIPLAEDSPAKTMAALDTVPPGIIASLQRDIAEGRPSELEALTGALVRLGAEVGVATPLHAFLYHSLLPQELRARGQVLFAL